MKSLDSGGRERRLTERPGARVAVWSPDGCRIAYDTYNGVWIVRAVVLIHEALHVAGLGQHPHHPVPRPHSRSIGG